MARKTVLEDCDIFIDKLNSELIYNGIEMIICPSFVHFDV